MSNKVLWVDKRIACSCKKKDRSVSVVNGRFVAGLSIQLMMFLLTVPYTIYALVTNHIPQAYFWLALIVLFLAYDLILFSLKYKGLIKTGHSISCARRLAFAKVFDAAPVV